MTIFLRLLDENDKAAALSLVVCAVRTSTPEERLFCVEPEAFRQVPTSPFAYWVNENVRRCFQRLPTLEGHGREAQHGGSTKNDFRFLRLNWEIVRSCDKWFNFAKGGSYSKFYSDIHLVINWSNNAEELEAFLLRKYPYLGSSANWVLHRECKYFHSGLTWTPRSLKGFGVRVLPAGCIFAHKGPAIFVDDDDPTKLLWLLAITVSSPFKYLIELHMAVASYEVGVVQRTPVPKFAHSSGLQLCKLACRAWLLKRSLDTTNETSHAFILPRALNTRLDLGYRESIEEELAQIQTEIDDITSALYGIDHAALSTMGRRSGGAAKENWDENGIEADDQDDEEDEDRAATEDGSSILSWSVGVGFGRFDWRLATGEREVPSEPDPFEPLPVRGPGVLPEGSERFHEHAGILVDDSGHPHDLARLVENVLERVDVPVPADVRRWLQRDFFPYHLQRYSRSRRKAPIYWPLSTASGSYTLWLYYPALTDQTLYTAANDFVGPKLEEISKAAQALRTRTDRSRDDEKRLEQLQDQESELKELQDEFLRLAPSWKPNHDDGVQITAAPLWRLFRHKPWQKVLRETWAKLEAGDYDWAHLAMAYWPKRMREKCRTDKSLAIAHGLEELYEPQEPDTAKL